MAIPWAEPRAASAWTIVGLIVLVATGVSGTLALWLQRRRMLTAIHSA